LTWSVPAVINIQIILSFTDKFIESVPPPKAVFFGSSTANCQIYFTATKRLSTLPGPSEMLSLTSYIIGIFFITVSALGTIAHAYDVTLAWDPNDEPDLAGYIVFVNEDGTGSPYYQLDAVSLDEIEPENPMFTATELKENIQYCFVLTAYNTDGYESGFSNEVCVLNGQDDTINLPQDVQDYVVSNGQDDVVSFSQGESSGGGGGCFISVSSDKPSTPLF
jgi:hypothetical protein